MKNEIDWSRYYNQNYQYGIMWNYPDFLIHWRKLGEVVDVDDFDAYKEACVNEYHKREQEAEARQRKGLDMARCALGFTRMGYDKDTAIKIAESIKRG